MERILSGKRRSYSDGAARKTRENTRIKIPMLAQEPRFNDLDKRLLRHLGIRVVENPGIWSRITRRSMVCMPGAEAYHFLVVARKRPAMWWPVDLGYLSYVQK
jgi:hypothetical protein